MRLLRDSIWQFIAALITLVALAWAVYTYAGARETKSLRVEILANSPMISVKDDVSKDISILYKDKPVRTLSLMLLRISNTGNVPILETDYSRPILFSLSPDAEIGEASITETKPKGLPIYPSRITPNQVELSRSLLNPGDQALLRILALNNDQTLDLTARIAGISDIKLLAGLSDQTQPNKSADPFFPCMLLLLALLGFVIAIWYESDDGIRWRQALRGLNAPSYFYTKAQAEHAQHPTRAINNLRRAFKYDRSYAQRALQDPRFAGFKGWLPFDELLAQYCLPTDSTQQPTTQQVIKPTTQ